VVLEVADLFAVVVALRLALMELLRVVQVVLVIYLLAVLVQ
jgi:hypothetical protein